MPWSLSNLGYVLLELQRLEAEPNARRERAIAEHEAGPDSR
jgi:hypothetical protein